MFTVSLIQFWIKIGIYLQKTKKYFLDDRQGAQSATPFQDFYKFVSYATSTQIPILILLQLDS